MLEADKRGTLPKSEKRQLLARRESGERGAALLRERKNSNEFAEAIRDSQGGLPRRFCESARNDKFNIDSSVATLPQNDKIVVENDSLGLDSAIRRI